MRSLHVPELRTQRKYRTAASIPSIPIANAALVIAEQVCATWPSPGALDAARKPVHRTLALTMTMMCRADGKRTIALLGRIRIFVLSAAAEWRLLHGWPTRSWPPVQVSRVLGRTFGVTRTSWTGLLMKPRHWDLTIPNALSLSLPWRMCGLENARETRSICSAVENIGHVLRLRSKSYDCVRARDLHRSSRILPERGLRPTHASLSG